ncbi:type I secretion system permease/ATPase [Novosphingobium flavum]|uniref:Type I secretion system permease/ATPase n=1 Tax=Novosphingobium flavum TaxID=1778672 RepID=A0A7X1FTX0_9SPHN|nr:type I secretion system permease/ATPase [Novosphingobium flavum]MBC2666876.1 type I secretion system permease/ATPase [Novosphingobium flavum]
MKPSPQGVARSGELAAALPGGPQVIGLVVGMSAVLNALLLSGSIFMLMVYDEVLPSHSVPSLIGLVALLLAAYAFQAGLEHLRQRLCATAGDVADRRLSARALSLTLDAQLAGAGDASQPLRDLDALRQFLAGPGPMALLDLPWMVLFLGVLFAFHWVLGLVCLVGAAILVALTLAGDRLTARQVGAAGRHAAARIAFVEAGRRNAEVIRALGMTGSTLRRWEGLAAMEGVSERAAAERLAALRTFSRTFRLLLQSLILAAGAALVIGGEATGGVIVASSILSSRALAPIDHAIANWRGLIAARQAWSRLAQRLAESPPPAARTPLPRPERELAVERLAATAPGGQPVLLREVSFRLAAGEALGVVGTSGSGKSSLARALVGLVPPAGGAVRLDGAALDQWEVDAAGAFIGYLPQDIELLEGTIAQNIARFAEDAQGHEVIAAARAAGVHDLVVRMPAGYDTVIGPAGRNLSAGQRQRIALARALFRDPFLLVLDEPNSNLDAQGDLALNRAVAGARARGAIVIIVAHRPGALAGIDKLLWLDAGTVRALGPKDEIMPRAAQSPPVTAVPPMPRVAGLKGA